MHDREGAELGPGELDSLTSPSLFGGGCVVVIRSAQDASKEVAGELAAYAARPAPDVALILTHAGGAKGKELLASVKAAGAQVIECPKVTRFAERLDFIRAEFRRAGRRADDAAARALLDAVGSDLRELAAACDQLAADTDDAGVRWTRRWWPGTSAAGPRRPGSPSPTARSRGISRRRWSSCAGRWPPAFRRC